MRQVIILVVAIGFILTACNLEEKLLPETGILIDIEGNMQKTVKIYDQGWMIENLKTTKYRNGDPISNVADSIEWINLSYCTHP